MGQIPEFSEPLLLKLVVGSRKNSKVQKMELIEGYEPIEGYAVGLCNLVAIFILVTLSRNKGET